MTALKFDHLYRMTDHLGTFEHARYDEPRREMGYCTDDVARVLVVTAREPFPTPQVRELARTSLQFLIAARGGDGRYRNRLSRSGRWEDRPSSGDCWGRSLWGLGTAVCHSGDRWLRETARAEFERAAQPRSPHLRATAFAALGAAELLAAERDHRVARTLLSDAADVMSPPGASAVWPWPEARLHYANAVVPEAMIAAGAALDRPVLLRQGLDLLGWLLEHETLGSHLSVTPAGGAGPGDTRPRFDQQPIEVAALADACARAAGVDRDRRWVDGLGAAEDWFLGDNDGQHVMWDPDTGGGFDGLTPGGPNLNQGAESTLALLSTRQHARRLDLASR
ncbi:MAG: glycosyltransferase [Acidimicrobiales bacterium]|jgi:hypothetical protein